MPILSPVLESCLQIKLLASLGEGLTKWKQKCKFQQERAKGGVGEEELTETPQEKAEKQPVIHFSESISRQGFPKTEAKHFNAASRYFRRKSS